MKLTMIGIGIIASLIFLGWIGLKIKPAPFPASFQAGQILESAPLPAGLPGPVERFYRVMYGENVPIIETSVISGRGTIRLFGLKFPLRFRFMHEAGYNFRSDIEMTFFGLRLMRAKETFVDGVGRGQTPAGVDEGEWFNQSANIRMWAEALDWFPAVLVTDPRVRWAPIDEHTAALTVPYGAGQDTLIVRFNPETGKVLYIEAMKYKNAATKELWINGIWMDDGRPWLHLEVEEILFNAEVGDAIRQSP